MGKIKAERDWRSDDRSLESICRVSSRKYSYSIQKTYTVEGYNGILRHFLARLRRKTKCYTKSIEMLKYSVLLLMKHRNKEIAIIS